MSNGYLVAAAADTAAAHAISDGFGLDVIEAEQIGDADAVASALASAANVGLILSNAAADDARFVALMQTLAARLLRAQLILVDADAREKFSYLPTMWPAMAFADAQARSDAMARQREPASTEETPRAHPLPPEATPPVAEEPTPAPQPPADPPTLEQAEDPAAPVADDQERSQEPLEETTSSNDLSSAPKTDTPAESGVDDLLGGVEAEAEAEIEEERGAADEGVARSIDLDEFTPAPGAPPELPIEENSFSGGDAPPADEAPIPAAPPSAEPPEPPPQAAEPPQAPPQPAPMPQVNEARDEPDVARKRSTPPPGAAPASTAPADATAFAPKKLRRGTPELVRIVVHQPKDLQAVIKAAKKLDPRAEPAPQGMSIGDVALGASIGVALDVRGAACDGTVQRRRWDGDAIDFNFSVEAEEGVKQIVFLARVFVDDAQIGVLAFTRNVSGPAKKPHSQGDRVRLKRHKRVFLSYSSKDRETVSQIATAYQSAGVEHFWDRTSLKSGEEWHPRLRREIDRADLFHLCWSRAAADSEWVKKEAEHALTRRRRHSGKPDITVQMLDGPPWAQHPPELDAINFDDFVRAAIVGYARGDGST